MPKVDQVEQLIKSVVRQVGVKGSAVEWATIGLIGVARILVEIVRVT